MKELFTDHRRWRILTIVFVLSSHLRSNAANLDSEKNVNEEQIAHRSPSQESSWSLRKETQQVDDDYQDRSLIINGTMAELGRYPYIVELFPTPGCGGSLIAPDVVLTAAHCLLQVDNFELVQIPRTVTIGRHSLYWDFEDADAYETINTASYKIHKSFIETSFDRAHDTLPGHGDVALIKLEKASKIQPAKISKGAASSRLEVGDRLTVMGYGLTEEGVASYDLMETEVDFMAEETCEEFTQYFFDYVGQYTFMNQQKKDFELGYEFCVSHPTYSADCHGDSGGPVIVRGDTAAEDIIVGTVSWGLACLHEVPSVYADIGAIRKWIDETLTEWNSVPVNYVHVPSDRPSAALSTALSTAPSAAPSPATDTPSTSVSELRSSLSSSADSSSLLSKSGPKPPLSSELVSPLTSSSQHLNPNFLWFLLSAIYIIF